MKLINPFNRQKKRDFIPLSLFPANKMTRTSMQLGRFVPVYCVELMQNNRIKVKASQLTRFATMSAPVMQNFSVEFGAYFVPYVALDKMFDSPVMRKLSQNRSVLRARDFFNPSTPDADRVMPTGISVRQLDSVQWIGSLFDHLQYADYSALLESRFNTVADGSGQPFDKLLNQNNNLFSNADYSASKYIIGYNVDDNTVAYPLPFDVWLFATYGRNFGADITLQQFEGLMNDASTSNVFASTLSRLYSQWGDLSRAFYSEDDGVFRTYFGALKKASIIERYYSYVQWVVAKTKYPTRYVCENSAAYFAYLSIYGHYCLNELYCSHDDFNDLLGVGYLGLSGGFSLDASFNAATDPNDGLYLQKPWLKFYTDYIRRGECLPVLWNKDTFTAAQREESLSSTPIGETITENFFNRMYARFKDLIARMGSDYNRNASALYGSRIPDDTLNYPQVVGHASFDVQVGDIAQTSQDGDLSNLGDFAGYAVSRDGTKSFDWTAQENGIFMICAWVRPKFVSVVSAVPRMHLKKNYFDYLLPHFGGVGYQDVSYEQLFPRDINPSQKFAIQERYFEYMEVLNECSGLMKTSKQNYHLDRILDTAPDPLVSENRGLSFLYMTEKDNLNRIFNDQVSDPVSIACFFEGTVTRQLPATIQTEF